jgi:hypothetical protein
MLPGGFTLAESPIGIAEGDVEQFERELQHRLPDDYREFLLATNGGHVDGYWEFELPAIDGSMIAQFYRLKDKSRSTSSLSYMRQLYAMRMPVGLLAIGCDPGGGKICLGFAPWVSGRIWFWDPGMDFDDTDPGSFENFHEMAGSFTQFLASLHRTD